MLVSTDTLRERFERLTSAELWRILKSPRDEYTPEARAIAGALLDARPAEVQDPPPAIEERPAKRGLVWTILGAMALGSSHLATIVVRAWQQAEPDADALQRIGHGLLTSPWTLAILAAGALWLWRRWAWV